MSPRPQRMPTCLGCQSSAFARSDPTEHWKIIWLLLAIGGMLRGRESTRTLHFIVCEVFRCHTLHLDFCNQDSSHPHQEFGSAYRFKAHKIAEKAKYIQALAWNTWHRAPLVVARSSMRHQRRSALMPATSAC